MILANPQATITTRSGQQRIPGERQKINPEMLKLEKKEKERRVRVVPGLNVDFVIGTLFSVELWGVWLELSLSWRLFSS